MKAHIMLTFQKMITEITVRGLCVIACLDFITIISDLITQTVILIPNNGTECLIVVSQSVSCENMSSILVCFYPSFQSYVKITPDIFHFMSRSEDSSFIFDHFKNIAVT